MENELVIKCKTMSNLNISFRDYHKLKENGSETKILRNNIKFTIFFFLEGLLILALIHLIWEQTFRNFNIIFLLIWGVLTLVLALSFQSFGLIAFKLMMRKFSSNNIFDKNVTLIFNKHSITLIGDATSMTVPYKKSYETEQFFVITGLTGIEKESLSEEEIVKVREFLKRKTKLIRGNRNNNCGQV